MTTQMIEIEAESLDEARCRIEEHIPEGFCLISEKIISDGRPRTVKALADTTREAFEKALIQVPSDGNVLEKKEIVTPEQRSIVVDAFDEQKAISYARQQSISQSGNAIVVNSVKLVTAGRKGIFGLGKTPHKYEVEIFRQAAVEIGYKTKARISLELLDIATFEEQKRFEEEQLQYEAEEESHRRQEELSDDDVRDSAWRRWLE
jgi:hypothetical protein